MYYFNLLIPKHNFLKIKKYYFNIFMSKNILKITAITFSKTLLILNMLHRGLYFF